MHGFKNYFPQYPMRKVVVDGPGRCFHFIDMKSKAEAK